MKRSVLITGANGYIGSHVVRYLCGFPEKYQIIATDIHNNNVDTKAIFIMADLLQTHRDFYSLFGRPSCCIHLAWRDGFNHNALSHINDIPAHFYFLRSLIDGGLKQLVVAGSFREYGNHEGRASEDLYIEPENLYVTGKMALRNALNVILKSRNDICFQWIRPFTVYGDDYLSQSLYGKIIRWEAEGRASFPFTSGDEEYDYIHVNELSRQIEAIISQTTIDGVINCCSGKPTRLKEMIEAYLNENNLKIKPKYGKYPHRPYDSMVIYGDNTKILKITSDNLV